MAEEKQFLANTIKTYRIPDYMKKKKVNKISITSKFTPGSQIS